MIFLLYMYIPGAAKIGLFHFMGLAFTPPTTTDTIDARPPSTPSRDGGSIRVASTFSLSNIISLNGTGGSGNSGERGEGRRELGGV